MRIKLFNLHDFFLSLCLNAAMSSEVSVLKMRQEILRMAAEGDSVHIGCAFSIVEIVSEIFRQIMSRGKVSVDDPLRDRLVLSKGHGVMTIYAAFRQLGWLDPETTGKYFSDGSLLHGLSEAKIPGLEVTSGSLGHGLPVAVGMALGFRRRRETQQIYCIVGDGEMNEGTMWEALLFAGHHQLSNLTIIVDANGYQAMGPTKEILKMESWSEKFASFGFEVRDCAGHDVNELRDSLQAFRSAKKPQALIAHTVKGHGVSFMAGQNDWHYRRLTPELLAQAMKELEG